MLEDFDRIHDEIFRMLTPTEMISKRVSLLVEELLKVYRNMLTAPAEQEFLAGKYAPIKNRSIYGHQLNLFINTIHQRLIGYIFTPLTGIEKPADSNIFANVKPLQLAEITETGRISFAKRAIHVLNLGVAEDLVRLNTPAGLFLDTISNMSASECHYAGMYIISNFQKTWIYVKLGGEHVAKIYLNFLDPSKGGQISFNWVEAFDNFSNQRTLLLMESLLSRWGFHVRIENNIITAQFDKNCGASQVDEIKNNTIALTRMIASLFQFDAQFEDSAAKGLWNIILRDWERYFEIALNGYPKEIRYADKQHKSDFLLKIRQVGDQIIPLLNRELYRLELPAISPESLLKRQFGRAIVNEGLNIPIIKGLRTGRYIYQDQTLL